MTIDDPVARADDLRTRAAAAIGAAAAARELAIDIDRRRMVVEGRLADVVARHTETVWASAAADRSRADLRNFVGFSLWAAGRSLYATRIALEGRATELEEGARHHLRQASAVEAAIAADVETAAS